MEVLVSHGKHSSEPTGLQVTVALSFPTLRTIYRFRCRGSARIFYRRVQRDGVNGTGVRTIKCMGVQKKTGKDMRHFCTSDQIILIRCNNYIFHVFSGILTLIIVKYAHFYSQHICIN